MKKCLFLVVVLVSGTTALLAQNERSIKVCVVQKGELKAVDAIYNTQTGDTTVAVGGKKKPFQEVYGKTGDYAAGKEWYINSTSIKIKDTQYGKYGLPRVLSTTDVVKGGMYDGITYFVEPGLTGTPEIIYVPVATGCEFQPYAKGF